MKKDTDWEVLDQPITPKRLISGERTPWFYAGKLMKRRICDEWFYRHPTADEDFEILKREGW